MGWAEDHRLLVRRSDLDTVLAIVKRSQSNLDPEQSDIAP
jgi:hypothetical protein